MGVFPANSAGLFLNNLICHYMSMDLESHFFEAALE